MRYYTRGAVIVCLLACLLCCDSASLSAQNKYNANWFFGFGIGLTFDRGAPRLIDGSEIRSSESAAAISNPFTGELLFYTDGQLVWNRQHRLMPGGVGLRGHPTSTQGALIMPKSCDEFYIFTSDAGLYEKIPNLGIHYSVVDMRKDNGFGQVVLSNVFMLQPASEKLTAVLHDNGEDYWVIGHELGTDAFYAWPVLEGEIGDPVISKVGLSYSGNSLAGVGQLVASPNGRLIAAATFDQQHVELFNFDSRTGQLTNPVQLNPSNQTYGVAFSPDNSKLYVSSVLEPGRPSRFMQYDLQAGDDDAVRASMTVIFSTNNRNLSPTGMQLAPDGKIYVGMLDAGFIGVINKPNNAGSGSDFQPRALIFTGGKKNGLGLVNMYAGPPVPIKVEELPDIKAIEDTVICMGSGVRLNVEGPEGRYEWSPARSLNDANGTSPLAKPTRTTQYTVSYISICGISTDEVTVVVRPGPEISVTKNQVVCRGAAVKLGVTGGGISYRWSPAETLSDATSATPMAAPDSTTTYTVLVTDENGCTAEETIRVRVRDSPEFDLGRDTTVCPDIPVQLQASDGVRYEWWPAEGLSAVDIPNPIARTEEARTYYVRVYGANNCFTVDSIRINVGGSIKFDAGEVVPICRGESIELPVDGPDGNYEWLPAEGLDDPFAKRPIARPESSTTYTVNFSSPCGSTVGSIRVEVLEPPAVTVSEAVSICRNGAPAQLEAGGGLSYAWLPIEGLDDPASARPLAAPEETTEYTVRVRGENGCEAEATVLVTVGDAPVLETSADELICPGESVQLEVSGAQSYEWQPAEGLSATDLPNPIARPKQSTTYYVRGFAGEDCSALDSVRVEVRPQPPIRVSQDRDICRGDVVELSATGGASYRWQPAEGLSDPEARTPIAEPTSTTRYTVEITSDEGCVFSSSVTITVLPAPSADAGPDVIICRGEAVELQASGGERYEWSPAEGLSDPAIANPIASPSETQIYQLTVYDANGCSARDDVSVQVIPAPDMDVPEDTRVCLGDSVQLRAGGGSSYRWEPAEGLSDPTSSSPFASPAKTTEYTLVINDGEDCNTEHVVRVQVDPRVVITLSALEPTKEYLPGESAPILVEIERSGSNDIDWAIDDFEILLGYDPRSLHYVPGSIRPASGLDDWNMNAEESGDGGTLVLRGIKGNSPLLNVSSLIIDLRILLFPLPDLRVPLETMSATFAGTDECVKFENTELLLSSLCLRLHRGVTVSGFGYALLQNTPNPAGVDTELAYSLGLDAMTSLTLYNSLGQEVRVLVDAWQEAGAYRLRIDTDDLPAGSYFYTLRSGPFAATRSLIID